MKNAIRIKSQLMVLLYISCLHATSCMQRQDQANSHLAFAELGEFPTQADKSKSILVIEQQNTEKTTTSTSLANLGASITLKPDSYVFKLDLKDSTGLTIAKTIPQDQVCDEDPIVMKAGTNRIILTACQVNPNGEKTNGSISSENAIPNIDIKLDSQPLGKASVSLPVNALAIEINKHERGLPSQLQKGMVLEITNSQGFIYYYDDNGSFSGTARNYFTKSTNEHSSFEIHCWTKIPFRNYHKDNLKGATIAITGRLIRVSSAGDIDLNHCTFQQ